MLWSEKVLSFINFTEREVGLECGQAVKVGVRNLESPGAEAGAFWFFRRKHRWLKNENSKTFTGHSSRM
jgi:hypothetical protein